MSHAVYRLHDDAGCLLYVGSSGDPYSRLGQHLTTRAPFAPYTARMTVEWHPDSATARTAEQHAHYNESPIFCRPDGGGLGRAAVVRASSQARERAYLDERGPRSIPTRQQIIGGTRPAQQPSRPGQLVNTMKAARALGVHPVTLRRWANAGTVKPATKTIGGQARWDLDDVRQQLAEREREHE